MDLSLHVYVPWVVVALAVWTVGGYVALIAVALSSYPDSRIEPWWKRWATLVAHGPLLWLHLAIVATRDSRRRIAVQVWLGRWVQDWWDELYDNLHPWLAMVIVAVTAAAVIIALAAVGAGWATLLMKVL